MYDNVYKQSGFFRHVFSFYVSWIAQLWTSNLNAKKWKLSALFNWTIKLLKSLIYALYFHYHNPRVYWIWFLLIWILIVPVRNIAFELIKSMRNLKLKQMLFSLFSKLINPLTLSTNFTCKFPLVKMINPYNHTVQPRGKQVYKAR